MWLTPLDEEDAGVAAAFARGFGALDADRLAAARLERALRAASGSEPDAAARAARRLRASSSRA